MSNIEPTSITPKLTRKDFLSQSEPRWCSGCGCYSTLNSVYKTFMAAGIPRTPPNGLHSATSTAGSGAGGVGLAFLSRPE